MSTLFAYKNAQKGFTLIELIIVIIVIAILAAVAVSKYANLQSQARTAKAEAVYGAIRTAAALAKSLCVADLAGLTVPSTCTPTAGTVNMDGQLVDMVNQYPAATLAGIIAATQFNVPTAPAPSLPYTDTTDGLVISVAGTTLTMQILGATTPANCQVTYTEAPAVNASPTFSIVTTVSSTVSGC